MQIGNLANENNSDANTISQQVTSSGGSNNHSWANIFAQSKLILSCTPRNYLNPHPMITHAQADFFTNFGYSESDDLPIPLSALFGSTTEREKILKIEEAFLTNKSICIYINLHKKNGGFISCHISLLSLTGYQSNNNINNNNNSSNNNRSSSSNNSTNQPQQHQQETITSSFAPLANHVDNNNGINPMNKVKWAVMTIRSASIVGNSRYSGIGLLGTERIKNERLHEIPKQHPEASQL
jgi:hypothetical protein